MVFIGGGLMGVLVAAAYQWYARGGLTRALAALGIVARQASSQHSDPARRP